MPFVDLYGSGAQAASSSGSAELDVFDRSCVPALQALLPPGAAWPRDADAELTALVEALGWEFSRVKRRGRRLMTELDPRTTFELLEDWERVYGLPSAGVAPTSLEGRRQALHARMLEFLSPTPAAFIELAAACGYTATVQEPYGDLVARCGRARCGDTLYGEAWAHVWILVVEDPPPGPALTHAQLEAVIRRSTPSHTLVVFSYV